MMRRASSLILQDCHCSRPLVIFLIRPLDHSYCSSSIAAAITTTAASSLHLRSCQNLGPKQQHVVTTTVTKTGSHFETRRYFAKGRRFDDTDVDDTPLVDLDDLKKKVGKKVKKKDLKMKKMAKKRNVDDVGFNGLSRTRRNVHERYSSSESEKEEEEKDVDFQKDVEEDPSESNDDDDEEESDFEEEEDDDDKEGGDKEGDEKDSDDDDEEEDDDDENDDKNENEGNNAAADNNNLGDSQQIRSDQKKGQERVLVNEGLIRQLMRQSGGARSAKDVQVRLVAGQGRDKKPLVEIKTLDEAIMIASKSRLDLVGISLQHDPPVVAARNLKSYLRQKEQAMAKAERKQAKPEKRFRFRVGIAQADLDRRMKEVLSFLSMGHVCVISATAPGRATGVDKEKSMVAFLNMIISRVGDAGTTPDDTEIDEGARFINIRIVPTRKGKSKKQ